MNEELIAELQNLVKNFETLESQESYEQLAKFLATHVPLFREVYFQVNSSAYAYFASDE